MRIFLKYVFIFIAFSQFFISCEEMEDFGKEIKAPEKLVFINPALSKFTTQIAHTPVGSFYSFDVKFPVMANSSLHEATTVTMEVDNSLVEKYNTENGTKYTPLPDGVLKSENLSQLLIPTGSLVSTDSIRLFLEGDLSALTQKDGYLAAFKLSTKNGISTSEEYNTLFIFVETSFSLIIRDPKDDDIKGSLVSDRSGWSVDGTGNKNLFDGDKYSSYSGFDLDNAHLIDLGKEYQLRSLSFYSQYAVFGSVYSPSKYYIRYSLDGVNFNEIGTATSEHIFVLDETQRVVLYAPLKVRYLEVTPSECLYYYGMAEFNIYEE